MRIFSEMTVLFQGVSLRLVVVTPSSLVPGQGRSLDAISEELAADGLQRCPDGLAEVIQRDHATHLVGQCVIVASETEAPSLYCDEGETELTLEPEFLDLAEQRYDGLNRFLFVCA